MIYLKTYPRISDVPPSTVAQLKRLGMRGDLMRRWALKGDPPAVVAFNQPHLGEDRGTHVVGWSVMVQPDGDAPPYVSVFVDPEWQRLGVGTRLVRQMNQRLGRLGRFGMVGTAKTTDLARLADWDGLG